MIYYNLRKLDGGKVYFEASIVCIFWSDFLCRKGI